MSFLKRKSVEEIDLKGKKVLVRTDFDVPTIEGKISCNQKIVAAVNTIKYVLESGAKAVILISYLGQPRGQRSEKYSLKVVLEELQKLLDRNVIFINDCMGPDVDNACANPEHGSVILLENLGFHIEEEGKIEEDGRKIKAEESALRIFRGSLSKQADVFVNDAFGASHRPHSSIAGITIETRVAGLLMKKELDSFAKVLDRPTTPFLAILGGVKLSNKLQLIDNLLDKVTDIIVVGGVAFTFLKTINKMEIGKSFFDEEASKVLPRIVERAKANRVTITLPVDFITGDRFEEKAMAGRAKVKEGIKGDNMGMDTGPESLKKFAPIVLKAKTILWIGPVGVYEWENFSRGTEGFISLLISSTKKGAVTVVGGRKTALAIEKFKATNKLTHVSPGGEATIELLEGKELPGVTYLMPP